MNPTDAAESSGSAFKRLKREVPGRFDKYHMPPDRILAFNSSSKFLCFKTS